VNPLRSIGGVLGGLGVISLMIQALEFSLVMAISGGKVADMRAVLSPCQPTRYACRQAGVLPDRGLLGGYVTARVAMKHEIHHVAVAAAAQTVALIWGFTRGEFASYTPIVIRVALIVLTGPAMMVGAAVRARAANAEVGAGFSGPGQEYK
jgi:hypothetical protein